MYPDRQQDPGGGSRQKIGYMYVPPRFSKIGSPGLIFWLENWGLRNEFKLKFMSQELKNLLSTAKIGLEMQKWKWVSGAGKGLDQKGGFYRFYT